MVSARGLPGFADGVPTLEQTNGNSEARIVVGDCLCPHENQDDTNSPSSVKSCTRLFSRSQTISLSPSGWIVIAWGRLN